MCFFTLCDTRVRHLLWFKTAPIPPLLTVRLKSWLSVRILKNVFPSQPDAKLFSCSLIEDHKETPKEKKKRENYKYYFLLRVTVRHYGSKCSGSRFFRTQCGGFTGAALSLSSVEKSKATHAELIEYDALQQTGRRCIKISLTFNNYGI